MKEVKLPNNLSQEEKEFQATKEYIYKFHTSLDNPPFDDLGDVNFRSWAFNLSELSRAGLNELPNVNPAIEIQPELLTMI